MVPPGAKIPSDQRHHGGLRRQVHPCCHARKKDTNRDLREEGESTTWYHQVPIAVFLIDRPTQRCYKVPGSALDYMWDQFVLITQIDYNHSGLMGPNDIKQRSTATKQHMDHPNNCNTVNAKEGKKHHCIMGNSKSGVKI